MTQVARDKGIAPFLILHVSGRPDIGARARRLANALEAAGVRVKVVAVRETTHASINENLRMLTDPVTKEWIAFVADVVKQ